MNREIKFRAWDEDADKMIYQSDNGNGYSWQIGADEIWVDNYEENYTPSVTIMQYSGLKDRNGVEIYEGDIIRYFSEIMSKKEWICSVEVIGATFAVRTGEKSYMDGSFLNRLSKDEKLEIIGNIYENPELLEETK